MSEKLLLVDGHSIANRAFYGVPMLSNSKGEYTNALHGFFNILFSTIEQEKPTRLAVAFDLPAPTFRHKMFPEYKGTRSQMPEELRSQIPVLKEMLEKAGVSLLTKEGFEADDLLGTIAKREGEGGTEVTILSGDRDLLQLADERITIRLPKTKKDGTEYEIYHPAEVEEKYGVLPAGYLQMKGLMGDSSDNIPGVPKIGEKTAAKIVQTFGTIENAIAHVDEVKPPMASRNLKEFADQARFSLELATIKTDVEDPGEVSPLTEMTFHTEPFVEALKAAELKSILKKVLASMPKNTAAEGVQTSLEMPGDEVAVEQAVELDPADTPDEAGEVVDGAEALKKALAAETFSARNPLCIVQCRDEERGDLIGAAIGRFYADLSIDELLDVIMPYLEDPSVPKIVYDAKSLWSAVLKRGGEIKGKVTDPMIVAYLLNATTGHYTPDTIASVYADEIIAAEEEIVGTGAKRISWTMLPIEERSAFFLSEAKALMKAAPVMDAQLKEADMEKLYEEIEEPLIEVLASMENEGISVDTEVLDEIASFLRGEIAKLQEEIFDLSGYAFNINSTKQLGQLLFEELGLPAGKKTKSGYSTSAEVLEGLRFAHPIVDLILRYRQLTKLESTYAEGLKPFVEKDGKIHCKFQQAVTATGRLSCTDPNLQNIPIREKLGRTIRRAFVPKGEDYFFMDADYSQIELRLVAHMAGDQNMIEAYRSGADIHRLTASEVLHIPYDEVTSAQRSSAKAVNFGIIYGMSAFSLANDLGMTNQEAKHYIDQYFARFPSVKRFLDESVEHAKNTGYGVTLFGRRRAIDELKAKNFAQRSFGERVAKNMPIQGSAADIIKIAMVKVYQRLKREGLKSKLIVQVHDELLIEVYRPEAEAVKTILIEEMQGAAKLQVPLTASVETGENWYEAK